MPAGSNAVSNYAHLSTDSTNVISSKACILDRIVVNKAGASSNVITVYDQTSAAAPIVGIIDGDAISGQVFDYGGIRLNNGLTVDLVTGTIADITVCWRE